MVLDGATSANQDRFTGPKAGDFSLCFGCGEILRFIAQGDELILRATIEMDWLEAPEMKQKMEDVQERWREFQAEQAEKQNT